jgi:hypothetical protein
MANSSPKRLFALILWAIAWAVAMIASAILLKGNPIKDWVQAALFIGAMTFWSGNPRALTGEWRCLSDTESAKHTRIKLLVDKSSERLLAVNFYP